MLAVPEFRALWFAEAQSVFGDQLAKVALTILVYDRTGSALLAAIVYALTFLSALAGGLGLSQLADRFPRRQLMVTCTLAQAAVVGLMAIPGMPIAVLCVLVFAIGLIQSPAAAAQNAVTREVFTDDELYLRGEATHCRCGMPRGHRRHDEAAIAAAAAAVDEALLEERRRLGEAD